MGIGYNFHNFARMRKATTVILLAVYLVLTAGLIVNVRFCSGNMKSMEIGENKTSCCDNNCSLAFSCCEVEDIFVQLDIDQHRTSSSISFDPDVSIHKLTADNQTIINTKNEHPAKFLIAGLSSPIRQPLWLLHCCFTYYG